jgi:exodeoxyribonuclease V alpha subunit
MSSAYYEGRVHTVMFRDDAEAFFILKVRLDDEGEAIPGFPSLSEAVSVRGHIPGMKIEVNSWLGFEAKWVNHEKYGKQLQITKAPVLKNGWTADTAEKMLANNGVAASIVKAIREHCSDDDLFMATLSDEKALRKVPGLTKFSAAQVRERWQATRAFFQTLGFLGDCGLPAGKIRQVWKVFEDEAERILSENPWELVRIEGITFRHADEIARRLGLSLADPNRMRGAVLYATQTMANFGHTYMTTGMLWGQTGTVLDSPDQKEFAKALGALHKEGLLVIDRETRPGTTAIYDPFSHRMEKEGAELLKARVVTAGYEKGGMNPAEYIEALAGFGPMTEAASAGGDLESTVKMAVKEWGQQSHIDLSPKQVEGVEHALLHPVSVLTGLPGTGKTTSLKAAVGILQDAGVRFLLCAPTGIAAKRLKALTGAEAYTIHRAFGAQGKSDDGREATYAGIVGDAKVGAGKSDDESNWEFNADNPHPAQVVIVDESSMIDQHLLYRLLSCTKPTCRLVFVGDHAQLPSVGPGNVLRELIESGLFPVTKLTTIFRQADTSDIVFAAHDIHKGVVPKAGTKGEFVLLPTKTEEEALEAVCKLAKKLFERNQFASTKSDFQILSPRHSGTVGVTRLNERLRELLNPRSPGRNEIRIGEDTMREDDRVMIIQNDYTLKVFNGDVGKINKVDRKGKNVEVKVFGDPPMFTSIEFNKARKIVRLAYACTVHKAQGLEYDTILMPVVDSFHHQLQRNLLYTAVTRAKKKVILVGTHSALEKAVGNAKEDERNTLFLDRLLAA